MTFGVMVYQVTSQYFSHLKDSRFEDHRTAAECTNKSSCATVIINVEQCFRQCCDMNTASLTCCQWNCNDKQFKQHVQ